MLSASHPWVVAPVRIAGSLVQPIGDWLMTATPFVYGIPLTDTVASDAKRLGTALADLHRSMRKLPTFDIPSIAALAATSSDHSQADRQLLHGDFSTKNVLAVADSLRIFDFDDCGYGPVEYDVANSLYMVLFDAEVTQDPERYETFRHAFVPGYRENSDHQIADKAIDEMIAIRIDALGRWLDDLSSAPIGIRTSSTEWLAILESFVRSKRRSG